MDLATLAKLIDVNLSLQSVSFDHLLLFISAAAALKDNITLMQPSKHPITAAPLVLPVAHAPPAMVLFFLFLFLPLTFAFVLTAVAVLYKPGCAISAADTASV